MDDRLILVKGRDWTENVGWTIFVLLQMQVWNGSD